MTSCLYFVMKSISSFSEKACRAAASLNEILLLVEDTCSECT